LQMEEAKISLIFVSSKVDDLILISVQLTFLLFLITSIRKR